MGQKNKSKMTQWLVVGLIVAVVALGAISFNLSGDKEQATGAVTEIIQQSGDNEFCANNPALDAKVRIKDILATDKSYLTGVILVQNKDTGSIVEETVTANGSDFTTITNMFDCKNKGGYDVFIQGGDDLNSWTVYNVPKTALSADPVEFTLEASQYTPLKVKCYDNNDKAKCEDFAGTGNDYVTTLTSKFNSSTFTSFTGNVDDPIDVTLTIVPNTTNMAKGRGMIIAINTEDESHLSDYDESLAQVWFNGAELEQATGLSENELRAVNSYELLYVLDDSIGMDADGNKKTTSELRVRLESEADALTRTFDPIIKIVALGDIESVDSDNVLTSVGFQDDSGRTELYDAQSITLNVG